MIVLLAFLWLILSLIISDIAPTWMYIIWLAISLMLVYRVCRTRKFTRLPDAIRYCQERDITAYVVFDGKTYYITDEPPKSGNCVMVTHNAVYFIDYAHTTSYQIG